MYTAANTWRWHLDLADDTIENLDSASALSFGMHYCTILQIRCLVIADSDLVWVISPSISLSGTCCFILSVNFWEVLPTYVSLRLHIYWLTTILLDVVGKTSLAICLKELRAVQQTITLTNEYAGLIASLIWPSNLRLGTFPIYGNLMIANLSFFCGWLLSW